MCTPHNNGDIMGGRHWNVKDPMQSDQVMKKTKSGEVFYCSLGCPEKQQVAQNNTVSYMWVNIYINRHQNKFGEFSCIFEEPPPIYVFTLVLG